MQLSVPPELCTLQPKCLILSCYFNFLRPIRLANPLPPDLLSPSFVEYRQKLRNTLRHSTQTIRGDLEFRQEADVRNCCSA
jgi:hypothetical protein